MFPHRGERRVEQRARHTPSTRVRVDGDAADPAHGNGGAAVELRVLPDAEHPGDPAVDLRDQPVTAGFDQLLRSAGPS